LRAVEDIDDAAFFARVSEFGRLPTSSAPTPGKFAEAYQQAFATGAEAVICLCVSSAASATYSAAQTGCELLPGADITVVDTQVATVAQGFMVLAAAQAAEAGAGRDEILARALEVRERTHLFAALSTLKYLAMSGRVSSLAAGLLDVKPVLTMRGGKLEMLERVRTQAAAWRRVVQLAATTAAGRPVEQMAILHADAREAALRFEPMLRAAMACPAEIMLAPLTPGLSVVSGPGLVGVVFVTSKP
jgi:DegV family protein with EDD domain